MDRGEEPITSQSPLQQDDDEDRGTVREWRELGRLDTVPESNQIMCFIHVAVTSKSVLFHFR